jgi:hypothetical protein
MASLVEELQAEALDSSVPIDDLLRKAKVVAEKLGIRDLADWVERELTGYGLLDEYPEYRKVQGEFQAFNPYHGWQPIIFEKSEKTKWAFEPRLLNSPVGELEERSSDKYDVVFTLQPSFKARIIELLESPTDVRCLLNRSQVLGIPSQVRNKILDWSLRLEKAGVLGDGLSFSQREKERAHTVSINVHGNVENLSNVVDVGQGANVTTQQSSAKTIDVKALAALTAQLRDHLNGLVSADHRAEFANQIDLVEAETDSAAPNAGNLRRALTAIRGMIRDVAVGAGGSLIAQGALALIGEALKTL